MKKFIRLYKPQIIACSPFFVIALIIVVLHLFLHPVRVLDMSTSIFYMDEKHTLAALFLTLTSFLVGYLILVNLVNKKNKTERLINLFYGLFFIILSIDEYFEVHEYANTLVKAAIKNDGIGKSLTNWSWIFPLSLIILAVFVLFIVKIKNLKPNARLPIILGTLSFGLVLIFELLGAATYGNNIYVYFVAIEEGMEMIGISFFLLAVLVENKKIL